MTEETAEQRLTAEPHRVPWELAPCHRECHRHVGGHKEGGSSLAAVMGGCGVTPQLGASLQMASCVASPPRHHCCPLPVAGKTRG